MPNKMFSNSNYIKKDTEEKRVKVRGSKSKGRKKVQYGIYYTMQVVCSIY